MPFGLSASDLPAILAGLSALITAVTALIHELRRGKNLVRP